MIVLKPKYSGREVKALKEVIESGWWGMGPKVSELEKKWAEFTGAKYAVAVNSCTAALDIAVRIVPLKKRVSVSAFTFVSSALAPLNAGHEVYFVDIEKRTHNTPKADIQVMYAGNIYGEGKIYDMAHAGGYKHLGKVSCWSFQAVKNLPAGDGGMITMNDEKLYKKAKALSWCGIDKSTWERSGKKYAWDYDINFAGLKCHMNDITAAIALEQLKDLKEGNAYRKILAETYDKYLPDFIERPFRSSTWHLYAVTVEKRNELFDYLAEKNINCGVHYKPLYKYTKVFGKQKKLKNTEYAFNHIISLPLHLNLTPRDIKLVCQEITNFYKTNGTIQN